MQILPIPIEKEITLGDDLSELIVNTANLEDGDILVVAQKIISKQEGRLVELSTLKPSLLADGISSQYKKDPRIIELILSESKRIVRMKNGLIIVETNHGFICANAGIDESNVVNGFATLLPLNSDKSAELIRSKIFDKTGKKIAVIISDTFGRAWRKGQVNFAIGSSGINPITSYIGKTDTFENELNATEIAVIDEIASAAELVMEKTLNVPIAIVRGVNYEDSKNNASELIREDEEDFFL